MQSMIENERLVDSEIAPAVSVVVPFFNVANYAKDCIESLLNQSFEDYELIFVDDGSTDNTFDVLSRYRYNPRVRIIRQPNRGLSAARNAGVRCALAELVTFVDGDDSVSPHYLSSLYYASRIWPGYYVVGAYRRSHDSATVWQGWQCSVSEFVSSDAQECARRILIGEVPTSAWAKMALRSLYLQFPFKEGMLYEDIYAILEHVAHTNGMVMLNSPIYNYRIREGSITHPDSLTMKTVCDLCESVGMFSRLLEQVPYKMKEEAYAYEARMMSSVLYPMAIKVEKTYGKSEKTREIKRGFLEIARLLFPHVCKSRDESLIRKLKLALFCVSPNVCHFLLGLYALSGFRQ